MQKVLNIWNQILHFLSNQYVVRIQNQYVAVILLILCLLVCGMGFRMIHGLALVYGLAFGAAIGVILTIITGYYDTLQMPDDLIDLCTAVLAIAIFVGLSSFLMYRSSIFMGVFYSGFLITAVFVNPGEIQGLSTCAVVGLVAAVMSQIWTDPIVIASTGIAGGLGAGRVIADGFDVWDSSYASRVFGILIIAAGIFLQYWYGIRRKREEAKVFDDGVNTQFGPLHEEKAEDIERAFAETTQAIPNENTQEFSENTGCQTQGSDAEPGSVPAKKSSWKKRSSRLIKDLIGFVIVLAICMVILAYILDSYGLLYEMTDFFEYITTAFH